MIDLIEKEIIKKEMDALCDKVETFCWENVTCEGCPLNNGHDDNIKAYITIKEEILKER